MSYNNLENFKGQDFLKSSQFLFSLFDAPVNYGMDFRQFSLFCESVEFPGKSLNAVDYKIPGTNRIRVSYSKEFPEVTMTFIHNIKTPVYSFFSDWIDFASGTRNGTENSYYDEMTTSFTLTQYSDIYQGGKRFNGLSNLLNSIDKLNTYLLDSSKLFQVTDIGQTFVNKVNAAQDSNTLSERTKYYTVKFYHAYPVNVASMQSSWADDGFHKLAVTWTYDYFTINEKSNADPIANATMNQLDDIYRNILFG